MTSTQESTRMETWKGVNRADAVGNLLSFQPTAAKTIKKEKRREQVPSFHQAPEQNFSERRKWEISQQQWAHTHVNVSLSTKKIKPPDGTLQRGKQCLRRRQLASLILYLPSKRKLFPLKVPHSAQMEKTNFRKNNNGRRSDKWTKNKMTPFFTKEKTETERLLWKRALRT